MWESCDNGKTIGTKGSENGEIILDEEHTDGARITLERGGSTAPWSVTCGIYGAFMHTAFASDEAEGRGKYNGMKAELLVIMQEPDDETRYQMMHDFAEKY